MDITTLKYALLFLCLYFVCAGKLAGTSRIGCLFRRNPCAEGEICDRSYFLGRCLTWQDESYSSNPRRRNRYPENGHFIDEERREESYEPTLEDQHLIKSLPIDSDYDHGDPVGTHGRVLPPNALRNVDEVTGSNQPNLPQSQTLDQREDYNTGYTDGYRGDNTFYNEDSRSSEFRDAEQNHGQDFQFHDMNAAQSEDTREKDDFHQVPSQHRPFQRVQKPADSTSYKEKFDQSSQHDREINVIEEKSSAHSGKVLVKGEVQQVSADIDQGSNPEPQYNEVKDFFESQQDSSIVEVPKMVQRDENREQNMERSKHHFIPARNSPLNADEVDKEQVDRSINLALDRNITPVEAKILAAALQKALWPNAPSPVFALKKLGGSSVKLDMMSATHVPEKPDDVAKRIKKEPSIRNDVAQESGINILAAKYDDVPSNANSPHNSVVNQQPKYFLITLVVVGCVTGVVLSAIAIYLVMKRYQDRNVFKPVTTPGQEAAADYQELCRQLRASQGWDSSPMKVSTAKEKGLTSKPPKYSWSEEPVVPNMDISTGHVVLSYMEDHLKNKDRLNREWEALKTYEAEPNNTDVGKMEKNARKNRYSDVLPYDHTRAVLKESSNATGSDYINASAITDHDPKNPAYIATQGPLVHTVADFWQMIWEQGVVVIVNLTKLSDLGLPQCHRYWPEEGHETYHIYEVHLVSEHIWCEDYLVRSFYLKNLQTSETRTVTQFHFLSWPDLNVPASPKPLLEFRRKVNKCFRGRSSPVVVHCSGGVGRTGTYILIDMVLNKMTRGAKEIDIAATLEHLRDQRPSMVKTKAQFEFALTAVAEEVNAILQALAK